LGRKEYAVDQRALSGPVRLILLNAERLPVEAQALAGLPKIPAVSVEPGCCPGAGARGKPSFMNLVRGLPVKNGDALGGWAGGSAGGGRGAGLRI